MCLICPGCGGNTVASRLVGVEGIKYPPGLFTSKKCVNCNRYFVSLPQRKGDPRIIEVFWSDGANGVSKGPDSYKYIDRKEAIYV